MKQAISQALPVKYSDCTELSRLHGVAPPPTVEIIAPIGQDGDAKNCVLFRRCFIRER